MARSGCSASSLPAASGLEIGAMHLVARHPQRQRHRHHHRGPDGAGHRLVLPVLHRAVRARCHLQRRADGLDAELVAVGVDGRHRHLGGRSSSAAKRGRRPGARSPSPATARGARARCPASAHACRTAWCPACQGRGEVLAPVTSAPDLGRHLAGTIGAALLDRDEEGVRPVGLSVTVLHLETTPSCLRTVIAV